MEMIDGLILFSIGIIVGFLGSVVGVGGGFIVVPFLSLVYHLSPQLAVGTSICIVALNSLSGAASYARQRRIDYRIGMIFSIAMFPGAFLGAYALQFVSKMMFDVSFGIFLFAVAAYIILKEKQQQNVDLVKPGAYVRPEFNMTLGVAISFLVGFVASMAGVGGGLIHVPAMIYLFHFPPHIAIPTSVFIIAISSVFAVGSHALVGAIEWSFVPFLGAGAIIGAQIGGKYSYRMKNMWVMRLLIVIIVVAAFRLISRYW